MAEPFISTPVMAATAQSPIADALVPGEYGNLAIGAQVALSERFGLAICDVCAWPGLETKTANAIKRATGLAVTKRRDAVGEAAQGFQHAPGRWTVIAEDPSLAERLTRAVSANATVVDLAHGRTCLRIAGEAGTSVLAKLFAIDFAEKAFPVAKGLATSHHAVLAQIQRVDAQTFDLLVFRSYARTFFHALTRASEEFGYRIVPPRAGEPET